MKRRVSISAIGEDGDIADLGSIIVESDTEQGLRNEAMEALWDSRLDAAGCRAQVLIEDVECEAGDVRI